MSIVSPSWLGLLYAAMPIMLAMVLLAIRGLGQVFPLMIALVRLVVQLILLGYVLQWLFSTDQPAIVGMIALVMLLVSAYTVGDRLPRSGWSLRIESFVSLLIVTSLVMAVALRLGLRNEPWYAPRVVIPLLGMVLGNSVSSVALAAERFESELRADRDLVELRLALGATSRQAALPALRAAVRAALTPPINNMSIAGIVSIPGMTTGQLLAGANVSDAIRYQILVYLAMTATITLSTLILLGFRLRRYFTVDAQLRGEMLDGG